MSRAAMKRAVRESVSGLPRAFWWLWLSTLVNRLGASVATFMALYLTLDRGYSASYAGLVVALHGLGGVVSSIGAGVMTDRLGRRPTLLVAQSSTAASVALLGFMHHPVAIAAVAFLVGATSSVGYGFGLTAFAGSVGAIALTVCVWSLAEIVIAPTQIGLVVRLSPLHGRGRYQGVYASAWPVASLVAPLMAGGIIDGFGT
ncbi:hypothetical protein GCM10010307_35140 [Streptomyces vastus]|uniref:Major facilitator superfamily (MFS) profile domain-containing protein n=1 Tax=Streptomyces vastus TaxID=285451 RepID=A0ABN3QX41_9ACTN